MSQEPIFKGSNSHEVFYERGEYITLYSSQRLYKNTDKIFFLLMLHNLPFADTYPDVSRIYLEQLADYLFIYSIFLETDNRVMVDMKN